MPERLGFRGTLAVLAMLLLVYSGFFKGSPLLAGLPIDLTVAGVVLVIVGLVVAAVPDPARLRPALPFIGLAIVFLLGVGDSLPGYGHLKTVQFYAITEFAALGVVVLMNTPSRRRAWARAQIALAVLLSVSALLSPRDALGYVSGQSALVVAGSNTISTGRAVGVAVVGLLVLALLGKGTARILCAAAGLACIYPLLYSGSRGPVAAAVLAVALVVLLAPNGARRRTTQVVLVVVAAAAGVYVLRGDDTTGGAQRVTSTLFSGQLTDQSSSARFTLWQDALRYIPKHPLGGGWGTFSTPQEGFRLLGYFNLTYPHNLLLEVTGEAGWLAGIALIVFAAGALRRLRRCSNDPHVAVLFGIAVFSIINALVSSDLSDRLVWASVAVGWAVPLAPRAQDEMKVGKPKLQPSPQSPLLPAARHRFVSADPTPPRSDTADWDAVFRPAVHS